MSLAKAREKHLVARQMLADGADPTAEKQQPLQIFEDVAREWHGRWCEVRNDRHAHYGNGAKRQPSPHLEIYLAPR